MSLFKRAVHLQEFRYPQSTHTPFGHSGDDRVPRTLEGQNKRRIAYGPRSALEVNHLMSKQITIFRQLGVVARRSTCTFKATLNDAHLTFPSLGELVIRVGKHGDIIGERPRKRTKGGIKAVRIAKQLVAERNWQWQRDVTQSLSYR